MQEVIKELFQRGAHFGYSRSRRHPSTAPFIFGFKNGTAIIDLEKTASQLQAAKDFLFGLGQSGKQLLLVGTKSEARAAVQEAAQTARLPYVAARWIGGILTNFNQIQKRFQRLRELIAAEDEGLALSSKKAETRQKKERENLERYFGTLLELTDRPGALLVIDSDEEAIAVSEAKKVGVPVVALANSDCDLGGIDYPIVGNDNSRSAIEFVVTELLKAYKEGREQIKKTDVAAEIQEAN